MREAVLRLVAAEVFQVEVAADRSQRCPIERRCLRPVIIEKVAGTTKESKAILLHALILQPHPLRTPPLIKLMYSLCDPSRHARTPRESKATRLSSSAIKEV